jgi:DMSO/TMAO reductase YedYZ molybdopterin-dependent catalytic subunit
MSEPSRVEPSGVEPSRVEPSRVEPSRVELSSRKLSRRKLITTGLAATAGASAIGVAARLAQKYGLMPPDHGGIYGLGETLTYASQRLLTRHSLAREFSRSQISKPPFPNEMAPLSDAFKRLQSGGFADWRLTVNGMVSKPASFSLDQLKSYPSRSQITMIQCEEGWSYIAEWNGVLLSQVLDAVQVHPQARYVVYFSIEPDWWESIDMADAMHPQTFLTYGMNGDELPVGNGGPLRLRVPRQLGYKNVKFLTHLTVTDNLKGFGKGLGSASPEAGYAWYAGI